MPRAGHKGRGRAGRGSSGGKTPVGGRAGIVFRRPARAVSAGSARTTRVPHGGGQRNLTQKELKALLLPSKFRAESQKRMATASKGKLRARGSSESEDASERGRSRSRKPRHGPVKYESGSRGGGRQV